MEIKQSPLVLLAPPKTQFQEILPLAEWAETFLRAKTAEQVSKNTIHYYRADLRTLIEWCEKRYIRQVEDLTPEHLREFLIHLKAAGHNPGGLNGHYRVIRTFLRWYGAEVEPQGWHNPCVKVKAPRLVEEPLEAVPLEDLEKLYRAAHGRMAERDRAIILTLADTGLRAAELLALNVGDVDIFGGLVLVRCGKGGKSRTVFIGKRTRRAVHAWAKQRDTNGPALFQTDEGTRLAYSGLRQIIRRLAIRAEVPIPEIHAFRRCFAISFLRAGGDLLSLQRLLGHADLSLLRRYANQSTDDLRVVHAAHGLDEWL